jgi:hypothetical protein
VPELTKPTEFRMTTYNGKPAVAAISKAEKAPEIVLYLDPESKAPVGWDQGIGNDKASARFVDLSAGAPVRVEDLKWTPGPDLKPYQMPDFYKSLLKVGDPAPEFALNMPDGKTMSLKEALKGQKALLLNFWFYG